MNEMSDARSLREQSCQQSRDEICFLARGIQAPLLECRLERHHYVLRERRLSARQGGCACRPCLAAHLIVQEVIPRLPRIAVLAIVLPLDQPLLDAVLASVLDHLGEIRTMQSRHLPHTTEVRTMRGPSTHTCIESCGASLYGEIKTPPK